MTKMNNNTNKATTTTTTTTTTATATATKTKTKTRNTKLVIYFIFLIAIFIAIGSNIFFIIFRDNVDNVTTSGSTIIIKTTSSSSSSNASSAVIVIDNYNGHYYNEIESESESESDSTNNAFSGNATTTATATADDDDDPVITAITAIRSPPPDTNSTTTTTTTTPSSSFSSSSSSSNSSSSSSSVLRKRVNFALTTGVLSGGGSSNNINNNNNNNNTSSSNNIKSINRKEYQNQNKNNKEKKKTNMDNKFILIHIGPSKTGTTSIQKDSSKKRGFKKSLDKDEVIYVGKFSGGNKKDNPTFIKSINCMEMEFKKKLNLNSNLNLNLNSNSNLNLNLNLKDNNNNTATKRLNNKQEIINKCWMDNKYMIESTIGIIYSNEDHSYNYENYNLYDRIKLYKKIFLDYLGYNEIIIVGAYRRYYDWIPSTYKERMKLECLTRMQPKKKSCQTMIQYIWNNNNNTNNTNSLNSNNQNSNQYNYNARVYRNIHETLPIAREALLDILLPSSSSSSNSTTIKTNNNNSNNNTADAAAASAAAAPRVPRGHVKILNYFQQPDDYNSISTELYCNILGMDRTPNTCEYSRNQISPDVRNKGSLDNVPYKLIIFEAQNRGWINTSTTSSKNRTTSTTSTTSTTTTRIQTWRELQEYHTQIIINRNRNNNNSSNNGNNGTTVESNKNNNNNIYLPLKCPSKDMLDMFLNKSLDYEILIMPELELYYNNSSKSKSKHEQLSSRLGNMEEEHINKFWNKFTTTTTTTTTTPSSKLSDGTTRMTTTTKKEIILKDNHELCSIDIDILFGNSSNWEQVLNERMIIDKW